MPQFSRNPESSLTPGGRFPLRAGWQRLRAIFSLNDPRWGRDGKDDEDKDSRANDRDGNRQQNQRPQDGPPTSTSSGATSTGA